MGKTSQLSRAIAAFEAERDMCHQQLVFLDASIARLRGLQRDAKPARKPRQIRTVTAGELLDRTLLGGEPSL